MVHPEASVPASGEIDLTGLRNALARRIALRTESQNPAREPDLRSYLTDEIAPSLEQMGFATQLWPNPIAGAPPFLFAERIENQGQHSVNLAAQEHLLRTRGALGCNVKWLFEMGEEIGSPGLREICEERKTQ